MAKTIASDTSELNAIPVMVSMRMPASSGPRPRRGLSRMHRTVETAGDADTPPAMSRLCQRHRAGLGHAAWRNLLALARLPLSETARELIATEGYDFPTRHSTPRLAVSFIAGMLQNIPGARCPNGRVRMFGWFVGIVISAVVMSSGALSQQSFQQLESVSQFEQALAAVDAIKHRKHLQCVIAIANRALCQCLSRKLPVNIYFRSYASIANQEKDGLEYGQLSAADQKIVDQCVSDSR
ncbi:MAG TPA: hypothetical protein VK567_09490 [Bradyrhizobium sp.]|nr:hypothetical protein [Bradyrhizobium sp.]